MLYSCVLTASPVALVMAITRAGHEFLDEYGAFFNLGNTPLLRDCSDHTFVRKSFVTTRSDFLEEACPPLLEKAMVVEIHATCPLFLSVVPEALKATCCVLVKKPSKHQSLSFWFHSPLQQ